MQQHHVEPVSPELPQRSIDRLSDQFRRPVLPLDARHLLPALRYEDIFAAAMADFFTNHFFRPGIRRGGVDHVHAVVKEEVENSRDALALSLKISDGCAAETEHAHLQPGPPEKSLFHGRIIE